MRALIKHGPGNEAEAQSYAYSIAPVLDDCLNSSRENEDAHKGDKAQNKNAKHA